MAKYIPIGEPINDSERDGIRQLRDELPEHYIIIGNFDLQLPRRTNTLEYDAVVVGEWGIYAVEIRGWDGPIHGDIRRWELEWGRVQNPFILTERKAKALRDVLVRSVDDFPDELFCEAVVFLTGNSVEIHTDDARNRRLLVPGKLYDFFVDPERIYEFGPGPLLDEERRDRMVAALIPLAQPRSKLPVIRNFELLDELIAEDAPYREFVGRHRLLKSRGKVRIKAYAMDPLLTAAQQEAGYARALRDMEALIELEDNPYVARPYEMILEREDENTVYMVSEWVGKRTLADYIESVDYRALTPEVEREMGEFARHLLTAISYMHQRNITHRNLHPGVIYLRHPSSGVPLKIADFDYARVSHLRSITAELGRFGAQGYVAPELWKGEPYDHRVDMFSAGAMLFELFTGQRIYQDLAEMVRHEAIWSEKRLELKSRAMRQFFDKLLSPDLELRESGFQTALAYFNRRFSK